MQKLLKSYTIVPKQFYVERDADRQLKDIIEDAGRPGYVLVARQMGKTNLLMHAKDTLESDKMLITYVDLSNKFENERDCFRNIIDLTIETHSKILGDLLEELYKIRSTTNLPAHKEHERELRTILQKTDKLVIILDEVDALTATSYSDRIFAQIRSIYFSRKNFNEFEKLTYVLSGVAEPSEIIRDKSISPFNIGQKIFLNDFSYEEFLELVNKAKIKIGNDARDRIYFWGKGNPRVTWEILSSIESFLHSASFLGAKEVDQVVHDLYLERGDIPPVDHIKKLAESNPAIRNSLVSLHYNKGHTLSIEEKNKLYLSGVIGSDFSSGTLSFKNEVLRSVLSLKWLEEVEKSVSNYYDQGLSKINAGSYQEAIHYFEKYRTESKDLAPDMIQSLNLQLSLCYYKIRDYKKALVSYQSSLLPKEEYKALYYDNLYHQGLCYLALGNYPAAIEKFMICSEDHAEVIYRYQSRLNLAGAYFYLDYSKYKDQIKGINLGLVDELKNLAKRDSSITTILVTALYNLGRFFQIEEDFFQSNSYFKMSLDFSASRTVPAIIYAMAQNFESKEKFPVLDMAINTILENRLPPTGNQIESPLDFNIETFENFLTELIICNHPRRDELLNYAISHVFRSYTKTSQLAYRLAEKAEKDENVEVALGVHRFNYVKNRDQLSLNERHVSLKFSCIGELSERKKKFFDDYQELIVQNYKHLHFDEYDWKVILDVASSILSDDQFKDFERFSSFLSEIKEYLPLSLHTGYLILDMLEVGALSRQSDRNLTLAKAKAALSKIQGMEIPSGSYLVSTEQIKNMESQLRSIIAASSVETVDLHRKKIGRNDIVEVQYFGQMAPKVVKYKKVIGDILEGKCRIIKYH